MKPATTEATATIETEESLLAGIEPGISQPLLGVGECIDDAHPTLPGRVRVRMRSRELWVPCLSTVRARTGDSLLVGQLGDGSLLVMGVIDGLRDRLPTPARVEHTRRIRDDEAVVIESPCGEPLIEVRAGEGRTTLRVLAPTVRVESQQHLELAGESVSIIATKGPIDLRANEDVTVAGETINLN